MADTLRSWVPFDDAPWSKQQRNSFNVALEWKEAIKQCAELPGFTIEQLQEKLQEEAGLFEKGQCGSVISHVLCEKMHADAKLNNLPTEWLTSQIKNAWQYKENVLFESPSDLKHFINTLVVPTGYHIAKLADCAHMWQLPQVRELVYAFFLTQKLIQFPADIANGRLFIPQSELVSLDITHEELAAGKVTPQIKKLLWRQTVRIRDAFAQGQPLLKEVPRKFRRSFKKNWLTGLEIVNEIERRDYDLWKSPITLSKLQRVQILILSFIGKGVSKMRG